MAEQNKKLHVSAYIGHHQVFTTSLLKSVIYLPKPRGDVFFSPQL